eukprot:1161907-Pelagomonas_calceolata.AAC.10
MIKHFNAGSGVFKAVDGVDVDIEPSTIVALLGPSGSGKTTLLRLIAGLEMPTDGKILFDDFDATNTPVQDRQIGFVFQNYALFNHKTVAENIRFGLEVGYVHGGAGEGGVGRGSEGGESERKAHMPREAAPLESAHLPRGHESVTAQADQLVGRSGKRSCG